MDLHGNNRYWDHGRFPRMDKMSHFFGIGCIHTDIKPTMMGIVCQGKTNIITIWQSDMAMGSPQFIDGLPIYTSIYKGCSIALFDCRRGWSILGTELYKNYRLNHMYFAWLLYVILLSHRHHQHLGSPLRFLMVGSRA